MFNTINLVTYNITMTSNLVIVIKINILIGPPEILAKKCYYHIRCAYQFCHKIMNNC